MTKAKYNQGSNKNFEHQMPVNTTNLKIIRRRIYAKEKPLKPFDKNKQGRIMDKESYKKWKTDTTKLKDSKEKD